MTAPQPLATAVPFFDLPLKGLFGLVVFISPPFFKFLTSAAFVFLTTVLPFLPALFFF